MTGPPATVNEAGSRPQWASDHGPTAIGTAEHEHGTAKVQHGQTLPEHQGWTVDQGSQTPPLSVLKPCHISHLCCAKSL